MRGDRASLRRCHNRLEVSFVPAYHLIRAELSQFGQVHTDRLALVVGILAHVRTHDPTSTFPQQLAGPTAGATKPRVSNLRFRRLLMINDPDELFPAMVRIVHLIGGQANVTNLAQGLYWWNEQTKKDWAFAYYEKCLASGFIDPKTWKFR